MKAFSAIVLGAALAALAPSLAHAQAGCADLNNDGSVGTADATLLNQCLLAPLSCPATVCGTGNVLACGDVLDDNTLTQADLAALVDSLAGLETLFDRCDGPGADVGGCPGPVILASQTISANQTWPVGCDIRLNGTIFVADGAVLTVEAGAVIKGIKGSPDPAALIFLPGSKIDAQGLPSSPIIFTSDQADEARGKGDWAGLMINGRSTVNRPNCLNNAEGIPAAYGGCVNNDSSGEARYVRVEYAGLDFTPNNELNLFTMNAIGTGTKFDFIQAHVGDDDCLEWFGGTANHKFMVASGCGDDGFDWQLGWTGTVQYGLMAQKKDLTDATARDSRAIEADNSEFGANDLPRSNPKLCNLTFMSDLSADNAGSDAGILFRRGTAGTVANAIVLGFQDAGLELRDSATTTQACVSDIVLGTGLVVQNSVFWNNGTGFAALTATEHCKNSTCFNGAAVTNSFACDHNAECVANDAAFPFCHIANGVCSPCDFYDASVASRNVINADGSNAVNANLSMTWPADAALYDGRPSSAAGFPAAADCTTISDQFEDSGFVGAFDPSGPAFGWLNSNWNSFDPD